MSSPDRKKAPTISHEPEALRAVHPPFDQFFIELERVGTDGKRDSGARNALVGNSLECALTYLRSPRAVGRRMVSLTCRLFNFMFQQKEQVGIDLRTSIHSSHPDNIRKERNLRNK